MPCPRGTYSNEEGLSACKACPRGKHLDGEGYSWDRCEQCDEGKYSDEPGFATCKQEMDDRVAGGPLTKACDSGCEMTDAMSAQDSTGAPPCSSECASRAATLQFSTW